MTGIGMLTPSFLAVLLLHLLSASAEKDDSYYMPGSGNPNVEEKMYWKDADNVLQDLSKFSALYVQYSHCAWTWMQMEEADNDVDENDYWYMGKVPPMGANVAYSLYGSLKGETFSGCNEKTFINSFYTNTGFQDYAQAMYYSGQSGFSAYAYDDDSSGGISAGCGGGYGVGCDATYGFALHTYSTDVCNPQYANGVKDPLYDLNTALESTTCVKIYDSSSYSGYSDGTALQLLSYSSACFYQNFYSPDGECPDPYGKIKYYRQNFANGLKREKRSQPYEIYTHEVRKGKILVSIGILLVVVAGALLATEMRNARRVKKCKHSLNDDGSDGLVKSVSDEHEPNGKTSFGGFYGGFRQEEKMTGKPENADNVQVPQDDFSPRQPPVQMEMASSFPPSGVIPQSALQNEAVPAMAQLPSMPPPPPPPPPPVAHPSQSQRINPSPLPSRDESLPGQYKNESYSSPYHTAANLSLLADALQPVTPTLSQEPMAETAAGSFPEMTSPILSDGQESTKTSSASEPPAAETTVVDDDDDAPATSNSYRDEQEPMDSTSTPEASPETTDTEAITPAIRPTFSETSQPTAAVPTPEDCVETSTGAVTPAISQTFSDSSQSMMKPSALEPSSESLTEDLVVEPTHLEKKCVILCRSTD